MSFIVKSKNMFVGFVGYGISYSEIQNALCEQNEKLYEKKLYPNLLQLRQNAIIGQLINTEFEQVSLPYIYFENDLTLSQQYSMLTSINIIDNFENKRNAIAYVADYDYEELRNIAINTNDFKTENVRKISYSLYRAGNTSFHDFVLKIMEKYKSNWFEYLQSLNLNVTYIFYDNNSKTLSALKIGDASNLYFGHVRITNEIFISNELAIVQKFCDDIFEVDFDCYFKNSEFLYVDKDKKSRLLSLSKMVCNK